MDSMAASAAASGSAIGERLEEGRLPPSSARPPKKPKIDDDVQDKGSQRSEVVDPDDDMEWWAPAKISDEDMERYRKQVKESGGYDVDDIPWGASCLLISPILDFETHYDFYARFAQTAVDYYNKDKEEGFQVSRQLDDGEISFTLESHARVSAVADRKLVFLKLLKINVDCGSLLAYLTFEAKDKAAVCQAKIYQAKVDFGPGFKVKEFREKPSQENPYQQT